MENFNDFFETVKILTPLVNQNTFPYTEVTYTETEVECVFMFKKKQGQGDILLSGKNSILRQDSANVYFKIEDKDKLAIENFILRNDIKYKIIKLKEETLLIPHVQALVQIANQDNIF